MLRRLLITALLCCCAVTARAVEDEGIGDVDFKDASVINAVRLIAELSNVNIIVSKEAEYKQFSLFVRNTTVKNTIDSICRVTGLWYDYNPETQVYVIMTAEQYKENIVVFRDEKTRSFILQHQNVYAAAEAIESLFGSRVELEQPRNQGTYTIDGDQSGGGGNANNSNNRNNNRNGRNNRNSNRNINNNRGGGSSGDSVDLENANVTAIADAVAQNDNVRRLGDEEVGQLISGNEPPIRVFYNYNHNMVIVRTSDTKALDDISQLIKDIDKPNRQVLLAMKILQVRLNDKDESSFQYLYPRDPLQESFSPEYRRQYNGLPNSSRDPLWPTGKLRSLGVNQGLDLTPGTFGFQWVSNNITANIRLLEQEKRVRVLATPLILAANNKEAELFIGEERTLVTGVSANTTQNESQTLTTVTVETEQRDIGNRLKIWPRINSDKTVTLDIEQEASSLIRNAATIPVAVNNQLQNFPIDQVDTARIDLTAIAKEGLTIAVGGMIREAQTDNQDKVPLLGDIPGVGKLFRSDMVDDDKTELVLLITPYIYDNAEDAAAARAALQSSSSPDTQQLMADKRKRKSAPMNKADIEKAMLMTRAAALYQLDKTEPGSDFVVRPALFKNWQPQLGMMVNAINTLRYQGWEVSTVEIENKGRFPLTLNPDSFGGDWVAFSSNRQVLEQGEKTIGYFVSRGQAVDTLHSGQHNFKITPHALFIAHKVKPAEELTLDE